MINMGGLAKYSQVDMLLGALPRDLRGKAVIKLELDPREPSTFKYNKLRKQVADNCVTADALILLDSEGTCTALGVSPYSIPAGVPLPQMPVVVNLPAIPSKKTPAPAEAVEEIPIADPDNTIDTKMEYIIKAFEWWTFQLSEANEPRYEGNQIVRAYPFQADHPPLHTEMNFPPQNTPTRPADFWTSPNYQQYPW